MKNTKIREFGSLPDRGIARYGQPESALKQYPRFYIQEG